MHQSHLYTAACISSKCTHYQAISPSIWLKCFLVLNVLGSYLNIFRAKSGHFSLSFTHSSSPAPASFLFLECTTSPPASSLQTSWLEISELLPHLLVLHISIPTPTLFFKIVFYSYVHAMFGSCLPPFPHPLTYPTPRSLPYPPLPLATRQKLFCPYL
jgi:hypothetical protein